MDKSEQMFELGENHPNFSQIFFIELIPVNPEPKIPHFLIKTKINFPKNEEKKISNPIFFP